MGQGIAAVIALAVGVAISPVPIIAVVLMLLSKRAAANGLAFLAGWIFGLAAVSALVFALSSQSDIATKRGTGNGVAWGLIALGVLLLLLAGRRWRRRSPPGTAPEMPKWMHGVESLRPVRAGALGVALAALNPKNLVLSAGAGAALAQLDPTNSVAAVSLAVFVGVASLGIAAPVALAAAGGQRARSGLEDLKSWLGSHNDAVMTVLLVVFGAVFVSKGLPPLTT